MQKLNGEGKSWSLVVLCSSCSHLGQEALAPLPAAHHCRTRVAGRVLPSYAGAVGPQVRPVYECAVLGNCAQDCPHVCLNLLMAMQLWCITIQPPEVLLSFWSYTVKPTTTSLLSHSSVQVLNVCERTFQDSCDSTFLRLVFLRHCGQNLRLGRFFSGISNKIFSGGQYWNTCLGCWDVLSLREKGIAPYNCKDDVQGLVAMKNCRSDLSTAWFCVWTQEIPVALLHPSSMTNPTFYVQNSSSVLPSFLISKRCRKTRD